MPRSKGGPNKSEAIRELLKTNPKIKAKEIIATLALKGIKVRPNLVYFIKGKVKGRQGHQRQMRQSVASVMKNNDPAATIRMVKALATAVGGLDNLKALVEALAE